MPVMYRCCAAIGHASQSDFVGDPESAAGAWIAMSTGIAEKHDGLCRGFGIGVLTKRVLDARLAVVAGWITEDSRSTPVGHQRERECTEPEQGRRANARTSIERRHHEASFRGGRGGAGSARRDDLARTRRRDSTVRPYQRPATSVLHPPNDQIVRFEVRSLESEAARSPTWTTVDLVP